MTTLFAEILDNHVLVICGTIALVVIVSEIGSYTVRWRKAELDAELKHEMLARGMKADQIVQVLQAEQRFEAQEERRSRPNHGLRASRRIMNPLLDKPAVAPANRDCGEMPRRSMSSRRRRRWFLRLLNRLAKCSFVGVVGIG